jgi:hypothetical protein
MSPIILHSSFVSDIATAGVMNAQARWLKVDFSICFLLGQSFEKQLNNDRLTISHHSTAASQGT